MARVPESWYRLFRSIAVPTLLIACPTLLAGHWNAWRHFLGLADTATQCVLAAAPVLLTEAAAALALALVLCSLIVRGRLGNTAIETCADVLTMLVIGYSASRIFAACRWLDRTHPGLLAAAAVAMLIALRVRNGSPRLHLQQYNASSAFILPAYAVLAAVLMPGRVEWRRFDAIPADPPAAAAAQQRPDVVLITFDALSAQDMSLLHYHLPTTPNFQRLARSSHVFTHFYSSCDFTTPAVVTLITGKDLLSHRVYQLTGIVPRAIRAQNVAQVLKDAGYRTMAVVTNNYAHPLHLGIDGSFDYLPEPPANAWLRPAGWPLQLGHTLLFDSDASPTSWIAPLLRVSGRFFPSFNQNPSVDPARVFDLSERLMASLNGPEFIWIHLFAPHF